MRKLVFIIISGFVVAACSGTKEKKAAVEEPGTSKTMDFGDDNPYLEQYPRVPEWETFTKNGSTANQVYADLVQRFKKNLSEFKKATDSSGAKLEVVIFTPDAGKGMSKASAHSLPDLKRLLSETGISFTDLTPELGKRSAKDITQVPKDGHWSKKGAELLAQLFTPIIKKHDADRSPVTYKERPEVFGDLDASADQVLDGGKDLPYHLVTNSQGLRMNYDLGFPKKKQRILFMGDSQMYSPFLDNEFIATHLLQGQFPEKEILNAGVISYSIDDFVTLYRDRLKYSEPDVIVLGLNANDIYEMYFSHRNRFSRTHAQFKPTNDEKALYEYLFKSDLKFEEEEKQ